MSTPKLNTLQQLKATLTDGLQWKAKILQARATDPLSTGYAIDEICTTLSLVKNEHIRDEGLKKIAPLFEKKPAELRKKIDDILKRRKNDSTVYTDDDEALYLKKFMDRNDEKELRMNGFVQKLIPGNNRATGIWIIAADGKNVRCISNCTITPLYMVKTSDPMENKQIFVVQSYKQKALIQISRTNMIDAMSFKRSLVSGHNFSFSGNSDHLQQIMPVINDNEDVKPCHELRTLGWQSEGFFAWTDRFFTNNQVAKLNDHGIGEHNAKHYFSPTKSILNANSREDENDYEKYEYLNYHQSPISFEQWAELFNKTYLEKAPYGVYFAFIAVFRDIILKKDGSCPHLYAYGAPESGKSKLMESVNFLFYSKPRKFNMNSGTEYALTDYVGVFRNCINVINEVDEKTVTPIRMQWLKGWFDNEGRPRGKGKSGLTEVMRCNSAVALAGQEIANGDNNALAQRCIVLEFQAIEKKHRDPEQMKNYDILQKYQEQGGFNSCLDELLAQREYFKAEFDTTFNQIFIDAREYITKKKMRWYERIGRNYCYMLTMAKLAENKFNLPWKYDKFFPEVMQAINDLAEIITGTDSSASFWQIITSLADQKQLINGYHYKIDKTDTLTLIINDQITRHPLGKMRTVLKLRFGVCHQLYMQAVRRQSNGIGINKNSLKSYLKSREYWIGSGPKEHFSGEVNGKIDSINSSFYAFDYDILDAAGYNLDYDSEKIYHKPKPVEEPEQVSATGNGQLPLENKKDDLPF